MPGTSETSLSNKIYASKIIKAGALLADTKTMLAHWDESVSASENLHRFRRENIFGKASRSRIEDILRIFRQRYLITESVTRSLVNLVQGSFPSESLNRWIASSISLLLNPMPFFMIPSLLYFQDFIAQERPM